MDSLKEYPILFSNLRITFFENDFYSGERIEKLWNMWKLSSNLSDGDFFHPSQQSRIIILIFPQVCSSFFVYWGSHSALALKQAKTSHTKTERDSFKETNTLLALKHIDFCFVFFLSWEIDPKAKGVKTRSRLNYTASSSVVGFSLGNETFHKFCHSGWRLNPELFFGVKNLSFCNLKLFFQR